MHETRWRAVVGVVAVLLLLAFSPAAGSAASSGTRRQRQQIPAASPSPSSSSPSSSAATEHLPHRARGGTLREDNVIVDVQTDCALKSLAWQYATALQGARQPAVKTLVHEALQLGKQCGIEDPVPMEEREYSAHFPKQLAWKRHARRSPHQQPLEEQPRPQHQQQNPPAPHPHPVHPQHPLTAYDLYIAAQGGFDTNPGTIDAPLATLAQAIRLLRFSRPMSGELSSHPAQITFRTGVYYFAQTVELGPRDSHLTIRAYPGEEVTLSGGVDLSTLQWSKFAAGVLVAPLPAGACVSHSCLNEMYMNGRRVVRARFPNANPETQGLWTVGNTGYVPGAEAWLPAWPPAQPNLNVNLSSPHRGAPQVHFPFYQLGVGGASAVFDPPTSFWGCDNPAAGLTYSVPSGLVYGIKTWANKTYADATTALVHAFHGMYWGNWIYSVGAIDFLKRTVLFSDGGFQEARGAGLGAEWYLENVLEELDQEGEWFVDQKTAMIFFWPNQTEVEIVEHPSGKPNTMLLRSRLPQAEGAPATLVASQVATILSVQGSSPTQLVEAVSVSGLTFAHTSSTFMRRQEVPSGGDWSLVRVGALQFERVRNASVVECVFTGIGGHALVVSRAAYHTSIIANEFVWIGASAVLLVGDTKGVDPVSVPDHPFGTLIHANLFHELGIWVKQSSAVFMALSQRSTVDSNICFNLARACINVNDGFGGGHVFSSNLLFNAVRETDDHGPFNSWDRQPFLSRRYDDGPLKGTVGLQQDQSYLTRNFILNNYHSVWPIDHDDGSQWYTDSENYLVYGGYKSYLGTSLLVRNNYYILPDGKISISEEEEDDDEEQLQQVSSIMRARAANLRQTYGTDRARLSLRDSLLRAGSSAAEVSLALEKHDEHLASKRGAKGVVQQLRYGGGVCVQDAGGYGHVFLNNTCTTLSVAGLYDLWMCDATNFPGSIPMLALNKYYTSNPRSYNLSCADNTFYSLAQIQALGYELDSTVQPSASLNTMLNWGRALFKLGEYATTTTTTTDTDAGAPTAVPLQPTAASGARAKRQHHHGKRTGRTPEYEALI